MTFMKNYNISDRFDRNIRIKNNFGTIFKTRSDQITLNFYPLFPYLFFIFFVENLTLVTKQKPS